MPRDRRPRRRHVAWAALLLVAAVAVAVVLIRDRGEPDHGTGTTGPPSPPVSTRRTSRSTQRASGCFCAGSRANRAACSACTCASRSRAPTAGPAGAGMPKETGGSQRPSSIGRRPTAGPTSPTSSRAQPSDPAASSVASPSPLPALTRREGRRGARNGRSQHRSQADPELVLAQFPLRPRRSRRAELAERAGLGGGRPRVRARPPRACRLLQQRGAQLAAAGRALRPSRRAGVPPTYIAEYAEAAATGSRTTTATPSRARSRWSFRRFGRHGRSTRSARM